MRRSFLAAAAVMMLLPILATSSSGASVAKIDVSHAQAICDVAGTISFNPPLTTHATATKIALKGALTTCTASGAPSAARGGTGTNVRTRMILQPSTNAIGARSRDRRRVP